MTFRLALLALLLTGASHLGAQPAPIARGIVQGARFDSEALGVAKHYLVYLPPSYASTPSRRYPVVYLLHGLAGRESDWLTVGAVDAVMDSLIAAGHPEAIVVLPDGDDGWYSDWMETAPTFEACVDSLAREAPERVCVRQANYATYVARDLVREVDRRYRTRPIRAARAIGGLSMGGYGALKLALAHPERFAAASSHSGAVSRTLVRFDSVPRYAATPDTLMRGYFARNGAALYGRDMQTWRANDPATLAARAQASRAAMPALYFDCGTSDALLDENRALAWELRRLGVPHTYREHPGGHTWRYWHTHVGESLAWMLAKIGEE